MPAWREIGQSEAILQTSFNAWDLKTMEAVVTSDEPVRVKGIFINGMYSIDQTTEVNSQFGLVAVALMKFPDTVTTPDPDFVEGNSGSVDRQIFKWRYIWASGQNNPVIWTMKFRAINVKPGEKLLLGMRVQRESGATINHRLNLSWRYWKSTD